MKHKKLICVLYVLVNLIPAYSFAFEVRTIDGPDFWISALEDPDGEVLSGREIQALNTEITRNSISMKAIAGLPAEVTGAGLLSWVLFDPMPCCDPEKWGRRYGANGMELSESFFASLLENMDIGNIDLMNPIEFGVVIEAQSVRAFPTDEAMLKSPGSSGFDAAQYSMVFPGERAALLKRSRDKEWGFFQLRDLRGWMRLKGLAFAEKAVALRSERNFIVVLGSRVPVYRDKDMTMPASWLPMGTMLYLPDDYDTGAGRPYVAVLYPEATEKGLSWTEAYVSREADFSYGFLPYTKGNIIRQAFKMLGEGYGWGGVDFKRDCSGFIKDIFSTVGINLPRNSREQSGAGATQSHAGRFFTKEEIKDALAASAKGITLVGLDGHVMLYVGDYEGRPFMLHQIFGYSDGAGFIRLNRAALTGLDIGGNSGAGAFIERITGINHIILPKSFNQTAGPGPLNAAAQ